MKFTAKELAAQLLDSLNTANDARAEYIKRPCDWAADRCERTMTDLEDCLLNIKQWSIEP